MADTNTDMFGGEGLWIFALLILLFGGGFGMNNTTSAVTDADLQRSIDLNSIQNGQNDVENRVIEIGAENTTAIKDASYNNLSEIRDLQTTVNAGFSNMSSCCCETQRAIDNVNYNLATQSAAIQANDTANTQKILDSIAQNKIETLQSKINELELQSQLAGVVRYPQAMTYSYNTNPFCSCSGCGNI